MARQRPASTTVAQLAAIERSLAELMRLSEAREAREREFYEQIRPLIGPVLGLESFLIQLHEIGHRQTQAFMAQNQGFLTVTDAIQLWLAHIDASEAAAEQERAAGVG